MVIQKTCGSLCRFQGKKEAHRTQFGRWWAECWECREKDRGGSKGWLLSSSGMSRKSRARSEWMGLILGSGKEQEPQTTKDRARVVLCHFPHCPSQPTGKKSC